MEEHAEEVLKDVHREIRSWSERLVSLWQGKPRHHRNIQEACKRLESFVSSLAYFREKGARDESDIDKEIATRAAVLVRALNAEPRKLAVVDEAAERLGGRLQVLRYGRRMHAVSPPKAAKTAVAPPAVIAEAPPTPPTRSQYETDAYAWAVDTAAALREQRLEAIDWAAVIEEIESVGVSQQHALRRRLQQLVMHLLKWVIQPDGRRTSRSWERSITNQRIALTMLLDRSPSLRRQVPEWLERDYRLTVRKAMSDTGLPREAFPTVCPWTAEQVLDDDFWPEDEGTPS